MIPMNPCRMIGLYPGRSVCGLRSALVEDCSSNHEHCSQGSRTLPSRVLDVGRPEDTIKFVNGDEHTGLYIALSYCVCTCPTNPLLASFIYSRLKHIDVSGVSLLLIPQLKELYLQDSLGASYRRCPRHLWTQLLSLAVWESAIYGSTAFASVRTTSKNELGSRAACVMFTPTLILSLQLIVPMTLMVGASTFANNDHEPLSIFSALRISMPQICSHPTRSFGVLNMATLEHLDLKSSR